jgi:hypothetical protein
MTAETKSYLRGHEIERLRNVWVYSDTKEPTVVNGVYAERTCGHCAIPQTSEGHDGCLGELADVMNACCGHGQECDAYVQFPDGTAVYGSEATKTIDARKGVRK